MGAFILWTGAAAVLGWVGMGDANRKKFKEGGITALFRK